MHSLEACPHGIQLRKQFGIMVLELAGKPGIGLELFEDGVDADQLAIDLTVTLRFLGNSATTSFKLFSDSRRAIHDQVVLVL